MQTLERQLKNKIKETQTILELEKKAYQNQILSAKDVKQNHVINTTKFKISVYYSHRKTGEAYTILEKQDGKNHHFHDSKDYIETKGGKTITRHDLAFNKLLRHIDLYRDKIMTALLFVNDFGNDAEIMIGKFNEYEQKLVQPIFEEIDGQIYFSHLKGAPLRVDSMRKF